MAGIVERVRRLSGGGGRRSSDGELEREFEQMRIESGEDGGDKDGPTSGYRYCSPADREDTRLQRKAVWHLVKGAGKKLLEGQNLTQISLPVCIFEPRSFLERLTDNWAYTHLLLKAAACQDPILRLKYVIAFAISGLSQQVTSKKPFNPILGETYQATFPGGIAVFAEQISHHPPVSRWEVMDGEGRFSFLGEGSWTASIRGNSVKGHQAGQNKIKFTSDGAEVTWELPSILLKNLLWGERSLLYAGEMKFEDAKNGLSCTVVFDPASRVGNVFSRMFSKKSCPDEFRGDILQVLPSTPKQGKVSSSKKVAADNVLGTMQGVWLTHVDCDSERLWEYKSAVAQRPVPVDSPLPTDCRFRQDLIALKAGDLEAAQMWKEKLEQKQREEAALRKAGAAKAEKTGNAKVESTGWFSSLSKQTSIKKCDASEITVKA